ncbi:hypothetical protein [Acinetobacter sp.]|uniref:hypothetical protein n=1 Tax=Acinetobacter sp. TaxID=472 RepID=UPI003D005D65
MSPQQLGGKSRPEAAGGTREVKPRLRTTLKESDGTEYALYGQMFQAYVQFDIWALTGRAAEDLAYWFQHDFMAHYGHILGSSEVRFYERIRDRDLIKINNKLQTRSLVYYILLDEYTVKPVDLITRVKARIQKG